MTFPQSLPYISVAVPTLNRAAFLEKAIQSVVLQAFDPERYEILVIDNASSDGTPGLVTALIQRFRHHRIAYIREPVPGLLAARHRGLQESRGSILAYIDDDIVADPGWLAAIDEAFRDASVHLVGGRNLPRYTVRPPRWLQGMWSHRNDFHQCDTLSLLDQGDAKKLIDPCQVWGLNFSIRKKTLIDLGGFNPDAYPRSLLRFRGDGETGLALKLRRRNLFAFYHPGAIVHHQISPERMTPEYFGFRLFCQGISDAYTKLRKTYELSTSLAQEAEERPLRRIDDLILKVRGGLRFAKDPEWITDLPARLRTLGLRWQLRARYREGVAFLHRHIQGEPRLLSWILKQDYFDYRLPEWADLSAVSSHPDKEG